MKQFEITTTSGRKYFIDADDYRFVDNGGLIKFYVIEDDNKTTVATFNLAFIEGIKTI